MTQGNLLQFAAQAAELPQAGKLPGGYFGARHMAGADTYPSLANLLSFPRESRGASARAYYARANVSHGLQVLSDPAQLSHSGGWR